MKSAFVKAYPSSDLAVDWKESFVYTAPDSTRKAMVRLRGYLGEFGYNAQALQYRGNAVPVTWRPLHGSS